jgi:transcriptional regulator with XRE-family HTH domain
MRRARMDRKINQATISTALNISPQQFAKYEKGTNAVPLIALVEFSAIMRVQLEWLVYGKSYSETGDAAIPAAPRLKPVEQEIVHAYRHIEDSNDRRVLRRLADIMAQGSKAFHIEERPPHSRLSGTSL